jgi:hypothetical protein
MPWLRNIGGEVGDEFRHGVQGKDICLYPVLGHLGWDDDRYRSNGLFEAEPHRAERRPVYAAQPARVRHQQCLLVIRFGERTATPDGTQSGTPRPPVSLDPIDLDRPSP